jgi:hypothetical protein
MHKLTYVLARVSICVSMKLSQREILVSTGLGPISRAERNLLLAAKAKKQTPDSGEAIQ